jgi:hypothetical protein
MSPRQEPGVGPAGLARTIKASLRYSVLDALLAASGALRVIFAVPLFLPLKEVRVLEHISYWDLMFKLISMGPRRGIQVFVIGRKNELMSTRAREKPGEGSAGG